MNLHTEVLNKILANKLSTYYIMIQWVSSQGCKDASMCGNPYMQYVTWTEAKTKAHKYSNTQRRNISTKILIPFRIKKYPEGKMHKMTLNQLDKRHLWQIYCQCHIKWGKAYNLSSKSSTRKECLILPLLFNIILKTLVKEHRKGKIVKERKKSSLFAENLILYIGDQKFHKKLLELITKLSFKVGYKINPKNPMTFLQSNDEFTEKEIRRTISLTITSRRIKYLGINLAKEVKCLYKETTVL